MREGPVTLGLIGYGWFADLLVNRVFPYVPEIAVTAVCDAVRSRREVARERLSVETFGDIGALLAGSDCEAVSVMTPHNTHRALVEAAAAAGRHIFCEKAMAVTVDDCLGIINATRAARVKLVVGHMQKLFPPYARVVELVRSGRYGRPVAINVFGFHWCPVFEGWWRTTRACGGLLYWTGVHDIDTMRAIVGSEVQQVYAVAAPKTDDYTEYEDCLAVTLGYENGAIGMLQVAEHDPLRDFNHSFSLSVLCERGSVRYLPDGPAVEHAARSNHEQGQHSLESFANHEHNENAAYQREYAHFARVVRGLEPPMLTGEDGLRCVEIMQAAYQSLATGQPVSIKRAAIT